MSVRTIRPYEAYQPTNSNHSGIRSLEQKVQTLNNKLYAAQNPWFFSPNAQDITVLQNELDQTVCERDALCLRVVRLGEVLQGQDQELWRMAEEIKKTNAYVQIRLRNERFGGGIGFGIGGAGAIWYGLGAIGTLVTSGVGALIGVTIGGALSQQN